MEAFSRRFLEAWTTVKQHVFQARYYQTYFYADVVRNILHDQFGFLGLLNEFYGDDLHLQFVRPFRRYSAFHSFIAFAIEGLIQEEVADIDLVERQRMLERFAEIPAALRDMNLTSLPINDALRHHNIEHTSFDEWLGERGKAFRDAESGDVADYYSEIEGPLDALVAVMVDEAFFVLFQNRQLLLLFNDMIARQVRDTDVERLEPDERVHFASTGVLKRTHIPVWVRRAVFFRDRGVCALCRRDVSGSTNVTNLYHLDHIVPLTSGGLNDVTNIQVLCETCNLQKSKRPAATSAIYESWYAMIDESDS